jgi:hypothetical protein
VIDRAFDLHMAQERPPRCRWRRIRRCGDYAVVVKTCDRPAAHGGICEEHVRTTAGVRWAAAIEFRDDDDGEAG